MSRKQQALFEPELIRRALIDSVKKLSPGCSGVTR